MVARFDLFAAAGEVVGFQLLVRGDQSTSVALKFDSLPARVELWQGVTVPAKVARSSILCFRSAALYSSARIAMKCGGRIYVPFEQRAGKHPGKLSLSDGRVVPVELTVLPFALATRSHIFVRNEHYGLPDEVKDYYELQRIAYDHRVHVNILHYSHNTAGLLVRAKATWTCVWLQQTKDNKRYNDIEPGATTAYWDDFREAFGSLLDGSAFSAGTSRSSAVPGFYLTFHESWPFALPSVF